MKRTLLFLALFVGIFAIFSMAGAFAETGIGISSATENANEMQTVLCNVLKTSIAFLLYTVNLNFDLPLSFLEIGTGLKYLTNKNMLYAPIFLISFQGLCIIIQSFSLIKNLNISFFKYLLLRILESITTTLIFFLIYSCFSSSTNELFNHF